jgi:hypothetical protein
MVSAHISKTLFMTQNAEKPCLFSKCNMSCRRNLKTLQAGLKITGENLGKRSQPHCPLRIRIVKGCIFGCNFAHTLSSKGRRATTSWRWLCAQLGILWLCRKHIQTLGLGSPRFRSRGWSRWADARIWLGLCGRSNGCGLPLRSCLRFCCSRLCRSPYKRRKFQRNQRRRGRSGR